MLAGVPSVKDGEAAGDPGAVTLEDVESPPRAGLRGAPHSRGGG